MDGVQKISVSGADRIAYSNNRDVTKKSGIVKNDEVSSLTDGQKNEKSLENLSKKLEKLKKTVKIDFKYEILKNPSMIVLKFVNSENDEVVRQIPPEDSVRIAKAIESFLGIFVDKSV